MSVILTFMAGVINARAFRACRSRNPFRSSAAMYCITDDLLAQILLHFSLNLVFIKRVHLGGINSVSSEKLAMTLIKLPERSIRPLPVDAEQRSNFQSARKRIVPCRPNFSILGARRNPQIIKRKVTLFVEADCGLRSVFVFVEQPKKLAILLPIPSGVADVHVAFILDFVRDVAQRRESVR